MLKQSKILLTGLAGQQFPLVGIRDAFEHLTIGGTLTIQVPHRDMWFHDNKPRLDGSNKCWFLPDNCEPPHTFSLKHVVQEGLNAICPEASKDLETLSPETQAALAEVAEGQGFWQLIDFKIEENHIIAVIKKI